MPMQNLELPMNEPLAQPAPVFTLELSNSYLLAISVRHDQSTLFTLCVHWLEIVDPMLRNEVNSPLCTSKFGVLYVNL